jgi:hypothetical protein
MQNTVQLAGPSAVASLFALPPSQPTMATTNTAGTRKRFTLQSCL